VDVTEHETETSGTKPVSLSMYALQIPYLQLWQRSCASAVRKSRPPSCSYVTTHNPE